MDEPSHPTLCGVWLRLRTKLRVETRTIGLDLNHVRKVVKKAVTCDHWNRKEEDLELIKDLNVTHYRFSLEWSRIEPEMGIWNQDAIDWYSDLVDQLLHNGIQPMVTLHHFSNPLWWEDLGAFEDEANILYWIRFCSKMFEVLSDRVEWWCTINEPAVYASMGYVLGEFPPVSARSRKLDRFR